MPIQIFGGSTGAMPAIDAARRLNETYHDARYAANRVTLNDGDCRGYEGYAKSIAAFNNSAVDGEQCWVDNHLSALGNFYPDVLNVGFNQVDHSLPRRWYVVTSANPELNEFNHGVVGGAYWSVFGPGKNLQLASTPEVQTYKFKWYGDSNSGYLDFYNELNHPGKLPEPVTLVGPVDVGDPNGFVLTCEESENAVGYELLLGTDPYRVMDYNVISDTPTPPDEVITTLTSDGFWWTVRARDQFGSTIYADPKYFSMTVYNPNPADGSQVAETWAALSWLPGFRSTSYDVYFSGNFNDVNDGTAEAFRGNQTSTDFIVGFVGFTYPDGLVPNTTYFWRVDDIGSEGNVIHKGNVWSLTVSP